MRRGCLAPALKARLGAATFGLPDCLWKRVFFLLACGAVGAGCGVVGGCFGGFAVGDCGDVGMIVSIVFGFTSYQMADVHSKETRSYNMSRIQGKDTKPEMIVRRYLHSQGFRYRLHVKDLPGKPDIVLPKYKTVIFIQGCFWHGHEGCRYFIIPKTRTEWWTEKISKTTINDGIKQSKLRDLGWRVLEIWECELKKDKRGKTLEDLVTKLRE